MRFSLLKPSGKHAYIINFWNLKEKEVTISFSFPFPFTFGHCMHGNYSVQFSYYSGKKSKHVSLLKSYAVLSAFSFSYHLLYYKMLVIYDHPLQIILVLGIIHILYSSSFFLMYDMSIKLV